MPEGAPILVVNASVAPGTDEAGEQSFNEWYTGRHISEVLRLDGFLTAERYVISNPQEGQHKYHTVYRLEPGKLDVARDALMTALKSGGLSGHPALGAFGQDWYEPVALRARDDGIAEL